jgi:hypothetical protein
LDIITFDTIIVNWSAGQLQAGDRAFVTVHTSSPAVWWGDNVDEEVGITENGRGYTWHYNITLYDKPPMLTKVMCVCYDVVDVTYSTNSPITISVEIQHANSLLKILQGQLASLYENVTAIKANLSELEKNVDGDRANFSAYQESINSSLDDINSSYDALVANDQARFDSLIHNLSRIEFNSLQYDGLLWTLINNQSLEAMRYQDNVTSLRSKIDMQYKKFNDLKNATDNYNQQVTDRLAKLESRYSVNYNNTTVNPITYLNNTKVVKTDDHFSSGLAVGIAATVVGISVGIFVFGRRIYKRFFEMEIVNMEYDG